MRCKCGNPFEKINIGYPFDGYEILRCLVCAAIMIDKEDDDTLLYTRFFPTKKTEELRKKYKNG